MMTITVKDLRCTATREQADNVLRKSWVLQMPEDKVKFLEKLPQETRFEFYESMDHDVRQLHIQKMRQYKADLAKQGIVPVLNPRDGVETLPKEYQRDTDEVLIEAAAEIVATLDVTETK